MRRLYFSLGKNKFWEYVLLALFLLFFYGPLMNMLLLSFAGDYEYPDCCFSKRMRKVFRKNEKSMLQNCNKKAKRKRRLQRVKKPM